MFPGEERLASLRKATLTLEFIHEGTTTMKPLTAKIDMRQLRAQAVTDDEEWLLAMNEKPMRHQFKEGTGLNWSFYKQLAKQWRYERI